MARTPYRPRRRIPDLYCTAEKRRLRPLVEQLDPRMLPSGIAAEGPSVPNPAPTEPGDPPIAPPTSPVGPALPA